MKFSATILLLLIISLHSFSQSGQWAWMKGDSTVWAGPVWGTKGIGAPENTPGLKYSYHHWQDTAGNFWIYSGLDENYSGYNDVWEFDLQSQNWIWMHDDSTLNSPAVYGTQGIPSPNNTPGFRYFGGTSWTGSDGKFWLTGGFSSSGDIMMMYDPSTNEWTWMSGSVSVFDAVFGTKGIASPTSTPGRVLETNASWVDDDGNLWFYGGQGPSISTLWKYDVSTLEWAWMSGDTSFNPDPVYGTLGVPSTTNMPGVRWCYASWKDDDGNFMLFGGRGEIPPFTSYVRNDLWKYNLNDQTWTWLGGDSLKNQHGIAGNECEFSSSFIPGARFENRACVKDTCGNIWMYGGIASSMDSVSSTSVYGDLWIYRPLQNDWALLRGDTSMQPFVPAHYGTKGVPTQNNTPGGRYGAVSWFDHSGNMWLFGGTFRQDLWKYIPDPDCVSKACVSTATNDEITFPGDLKVYPDPSSGVFMIEIPAAGNLLIEIRNVIGQLIFSSEEKNIQGNLKKQINLTDQASGIYFIQVKNEARQWVKKILIR